MTDKNLAVWFWRNSQMEYETFEQEVDAARFAVCLNEYDNGSPVGVQFSDGRAFQVEHWKAFEDAQNEFDFSRAGRNELASNIRYREIVDPFNHRPVAVEENEPEWLGRKK